MMAPGGGIGEILELAISFAHRLESAGFPYLLGGSLASSLHGEPRSTNDLDFLVRIDPARVDTFFELLGDDFYYAPERVHEAVASGRSFNLLDYASVIKVDVFVATSPRDKRALDHCVTVDPGADGRTIRVCAAEEIVLQKLHWYRLHDGISDRQWRDVLGVLKAGAGVLDLHRLRSGARHDGTLDLLEQALAESGVD